MSVLAQPTLVLNKNWSPINTVTLRRALTMVTGDWRDSRDKVQPRAMVLDIDTWQTYSWDDWSKIIPGEGDGVIQGATRPYRAPEIIIVSHYGKTAKNQLNFNRRNLFLRDSNQCQFCGCRPGNSELSIDHVVPRSKGGATSWENCVACCVSCNQKKADKTLADSGMKLIRKPAKPGPDVLRNTDYKIRSWEIFFGKRVPSRDEIVSEAYWEVPLQ